MTTITAPVAGAPAIAAPLSLDARLAATDAEMNVRLSTALLALSIDSAYTETPSLPDVAYAPVVLPTVTEHATPVAQLLERAGQHMRTAGWCRDTLRDDTGAVCLLGSLEAVASHGSVYQEAADVLLTAIRMEHPGAQSVPNFNNSQSSPAPALRALSSAAHLAQTRHI
jgi:hypothetical protein